MVILTNLSFGDIFMICTLGEEKRDEFIKYLNNIHQTKKPPPLSPHVLDVNIILYNGKIETDL